MSLTFPGTYKHRTTLSRPKQSAGSLRRCSVKPGVESCDVVDHHVIERFLMIGLSGTAWNVAPPSTE